MSELVELVRDLVAIDSVNPALVPGGAGEGRIALFVANWLARAGLEVSIVEPVYGRPSVVARLPGTGSGRTLMLNAHLDTVGVAGMHDPFEPRIEEHRLHGRGAFDMKSGLAAIMVAAAGARHHSLSGDLLVTAVSDEEHASIGTHAIAERWSADAAIVAEPTGLQLCVAHKGFIWLEVETHGVAAHGSRPDLGVDAILKMGNVLAGLQAMQRELETTTGHPLLGTGSLHASLIAGGQELSSYPERCLLSVERRTLPGERAEEVEGAFRGLVSRLAANDPQFSATVSVGLVRNAYALHTGAPIVQVLQRHAATALGRIPKLIGQPFWMDTAVLGAAGIPSVAFGAVGGGAHAVEEWVDLDSVQACADIILATALEFCA